VKRRAAWIEAAVAEEKDEGAGGRAVAAEGASSTRLERPREGHNLSLQQSC